MFEDEEENDEPETQHHVCSSIEGLRDHVLELFGGYIAHSSKQPPTETNLEHARQFLEVWEVESIVRELSDVSADGMYGIGANSMEEYQAKMLRLFRALASRILSNVMHAGVKAGLLDAEFNFEKNDFDFSITEKGVELARALTEDEDASDSGAGGGD